MPSKQMKPMCPPIIDVIEQLKPGQDAVFGPYVVQCYINTRKGIAYRVERESTIIARPHSIVTASQFISNRWSRFYGERKL